MLNNTQLTYKHNKGIQKAPLRELFILVCLRYCFAFYLRHIDVFLDAVDDHFQRDEVLTALGDDDVRVFLAGLHVELVHGLNGGQILVDDGVDAPPALLDVPPDPAAQAHVGVGVDEDLQADIVILCLCIMTVDGKVSLKERNYVKRLMA